ncbi:MAG: DUF2760 domain-containing protein [Verrucomicrobiota bacterium]
MKIAAILLVVLNAAMLFPATAGITPYLVIASVLAAISVLAFVITGENTEAPPHHEPTPVPVAEAVKPIPAAASQNQAQAEVVTLLGVFQEKGRLVDFLMEDITPHSDAEVGMVARAVHQGCQAALNEYFQIEPISPQGEGATISVPADYASDEFRLVGNLAGEAPFTGKVVHQGWKTASVKLPRVLKADRLPVIAPAQVEIQ